MPDSATSTKFKLTILETVYAICEAISFNTAHGRIRGSRNADTGFITNDADSIFVEGNTVELFVSGVDFPPEPPLATVNAAPQDIQTEEN